MKKRQIRQKLGEYDVNTYTLSEGGSIPEYLKCFEEIKAKVPTEAHDSIQIELFNNDDYTYVKISYLRDMTPEEIRQEDQLIEDRKAFQERQERETLEKLKAKYESK